MLHRRELFGLVGAATLVGPAFAQRAEVRPATPLVFLNLRGQVLVADPVSGKVVVLVEQTGASGADGVAISPDGQYVYWTNMGRADANDGSIQRVSVRGGTPEYVVQPGGTYTPKQLKFDHVQPRLYWSDREGMRVQRANPDGTNIETLVTTGDYDRDKGDQSKWCVGIALHHTRSQVYWTQKGGDNAGVGSIKRMNMDMRTGETPTTRSDVQVLFDKLPEPIDIEIDERRRCMFWTDRGDNTINCSPLDNVTERPDARTDRKVLVRGLKEAIGIALDPFAERMYYTSLGGELGAANYDGSNARMLATGLGSLTGVALPIGLAPINAPFEQMR